jgi:hypothetical protein
MFRKVNIPVRYLAFQVIRAVSLRLTVSHTVATQIIGAVINQSHFTCSSCAEKHDLFGSTEAFEKMADDLSLDVIGASCFFFAGGLPIPRC